jgi:hypothetical protein
MSELAKHYETLGLRIGASFDDVKKAYKKLAMIHHPDKGGDEEKFKDIGLAFAYIQNPPRVEPAAPASRGASRYNPFNMGDFVNAFRDAATAFGASYRFMPQGAPAPPPPTPPPRAHVPPPRAPVPPPRADIQSSQEPKMPRCFNGIRCTYFGCKFVHPPGYKAPEFPPHCHHGWDCNRREKGCIFFHERITKNQRGREIDTTVERMYIANGSFISISSKHTAQA